MRRRPPTRAFSWVLLGAFLASLAGPAAGPVRAGHSSCGTASDPLELPDGIRTAAHIDAGNTWCYYIVTIHGDTTLTVHMDTIHDRDLYARRGALPNGTLYDCRPSGPSNGIEACEFENATGTWYVGVHNWAGREGQFNVTATRGLPPTRCEPEPLVAGVPVTSWIPPTRETGWCHFTLDVPPDQGAIHVRLDSRINRHLFLRHAERPTTVWHDCETRLWTGVNTCAFTTPEPGRWHVAVHNAAALHETFTINASYAAATLPGCPRHTELSDGLSATFVQNKSHQISCYLSFHVPEGTPFLRFNHHAPVARVLTATPDFVPYTLGSAVPTPCEERSDGHAAECWIDAPQAGTWYVRVAQVLPNPTAPVTVTAYAGERPPCGTSANPLLIEPGVTVSTPTPSIPGYPCFYRIVVPFGHTTLRGTLTSDSERNMWMVYTAPGRLAGQSLCPIGTFQRGGNEVCEAPALPGEWIIGVINSDGRVEPFTIRADLE